MGRMVVQMRQGLRFELKVNKTLFLFLHDNLLFYLSPSLTYITWTLCICACLVAFTVYLDLFLFWQLNYLIFEINGFPNDELKKTDFERIWKDTTGKWVFFFKIKSILLTWNDSWMVGPTSCKMFLEKLTVLSISI